jgi:hypothetical protein
MTGRGRDGHRNAIPTGCGCRLPGYLRPKQTYTPGLGIRLGQEAEIHTELLYNR